MEALVATELARDWDGTAGVVWDTGVRVWPALGLLSREALVEGFVWLELGLELPAASVEGALFFCPLPKRYKNDH